PESLHPPPGWLPRTLFAGLCGLILIASFIMEAVGWLRTAYLLRAAVLLIYFLVEVPAFRQFGPAGSLATAVRIALVSLPLSYLLMAVWPLYQTSLAHLLFITGFSLLAFAVATWVMLGHSGQSSQAKQPLWAIRFMVLFLIGAMLTRVIADWLPEIRYTHYAYASAAFLVAAIIWAIRFLPAVRRPDPD
ncbi:MAG TPA: NnrS family protein, partial [Oceanipulchritudo sp.]|nr:NnrS family protein [Oceanipulchritudo sp.]